MRLQQAQRIKNRIVLKTRAVLLVDRKTLDAKRLISVRDRLIGPVLTRTVMGDIHIKAERTGLMPARRIPGTRIDICQLGAVRNVAPSLCRAVIRNLGIVRRRDICLRIIVIIGLVVERNRALIINLINALIILGV